MGAWTNFIEWVTGKNSGPYFLEATNATTTTDSDNALNIKFLMMTSAIGYLASGLTMCRFRTIEKGEEVKGEEYFRLNNRPNKNMSKSQFCQKLAFNLAMYNEALIVSPRTGEKDLYIADSWTYEGRGTREDIYRGITIDNDGSRSYDMPASQVLHITMNWKGVGGLLQEIAGEYEALITTASTGYAKQAGERGILEITSAPSGTAEQQKAYMAQLQERFATYYKSNNAVLPLHSGYKYTMAATAHRNTSEINDVINLTDEFAERVGLALRVPVSILKGNTENSTHARSDLILYGIKPIAAALEQEYNAKRLGMRAVCEGSRLFIDPLGIFLANSDDTAQFCEKMTSCGQYSVDELRDLRGEPMLGTPEAQIHYITKNYGFLGESENSDMTTEEAAEASGSEEDEDGADR